MLTAELSPRRPDLFTARHVFIIVNTLAGISRGPQDNALDETPRRFRKGPVAPRSDTELLLRIDVAAERLAVSRATLYRLVQRGEIQTFALVLPFVFPSHRWSAG